MGRIWFIVSFFLLLTGCYNRQFQYNEPVIPAPFPHASEPMAAVGVIEFDDMGELWERCDVGREPCQLQKTLDWIKSERQHAQTEGARTVVVTFVHGWRHNAQSRDENFRRFAIAINDLQDRASQLVKECTEDKAGKSFQGDHGMLITCSDGPPRPLKYIGVYIGWRGKAIVDSPFTAWSTILNRESGAKRVAAVSSTQVLYLLSRAAKEPICDGSDSTCRESSPGQFILAGHSFGGLIVEHTLAQALTAQIVSSDVGGPTRPCLSSPFADLVVLINPAIEALETEQLIDMMKQKKLHMCAQPGDPVSPPLLVSIKARNDFGTGGGFHLAHFVESFDKSYRARQKPEPEDPSAAIVDPVPSQRSLFEKTVGSINYFHNYCFIEKNGEDTGDRICNKIAKQACVAGENHAPRENLRSVHKKRGAHPQAFTMRLPIATKQEGGGCEASPIIGDLFTRYTPAKCHDGICDVWNDTPYWVFTVPKDVINGHGGFWNPRFAELLLDIVQQTTEAPVKTVPLTSK